MPEATADGVIDAHVHLWDTAHFELPWLPGAPWLRHRVTLDELRAASAGLNVARAVAVQAGSSAEEAAWLMDHTAGTGGARGPAPQIPRIVFQFQALAGTWAGTVQPVLADDSENKVAGIRLPLHGMAADWSELPGLEAFLEGAARHGLLVELLVRTDQLRTAAQQARKHPRVPFVLCHLGLATAEPDAAWRSGLNDLAAAGNVQAKVSGLFRHDAEPTADDARVRAAVEASLDAFGTDRLMFGSDWPMSSRIGSYTEVFERSLQAFEGLAPADIDQVFRHNAASRYGLA